MKLVYVCSPLKGYIEGNIKNAIDFSRQVCDEGHIPITPHAYFSLFLDDNKVDECKTGMDMGIEVLSRCDKLWIFGTRISEGMSDENGIEKGK